nr:MAG TPA: hypothetical protein [Caudoviricetes sp.]
MMRPSSSATTCTRMRRGVAPGARVPDTGRGCRASTSCVASCTRTGDSSGIRRAPPVHLPVRPGCCCRRRGRVADPLPDRVAHAR